MSSRERSPPPKEGEPKTRDIEKRGGGSPSQSADSSPRNRKASSANGGGGNRRGGGSSRSNSSSSRRNRYRGGGGQRRRDDSFEKRGDRRDANPETYTQIYVAKLDRKTTEKDIKDKFAKFGRIRNIVFKQSYAFIDYEEHESAEAAVEEMNRKAFVNGEELVVEQSVPGGKKMRSGPQTSDVCFNCQGKGHWANECKSRRRSRSPRDRGNFRRGRHSRSGSGGGRGGSRRHYEKEKYGGGSDRHGGGGHHRTSKRRYSSSSDSQRRGGGGPPRRYDGGGRGGAGDRQDRGRMRNDSRSKDMREGRCFGCGGKGHIKRDCPTNGGGGGGGRNFRRDNRDRDSSGSASRRGGDRGGARGRMKRDYSSRSGSMGGGAADRQAHSRSGSKDYRKSN